MHRRIHVAEGKLIRRNLPVGMHVPLAQQQDKLLLGEVRIEPREGDHVERQVPCREPRILPLVRHRDHVAIVQMLPVAIAAVIRGRRAEAAARDRLPASRSRRSDRTACSTAGRRRPGGDAASSSRIAARASQARVELIRFALPRGEHLIEIYRTDRRRLAAARRKSDGGGLAGARASHDSSAPALVPSPCGIDGVGPALDHVPWKASFTNGGRAVDAEHALRYSVSFSVNRSSLDPSASSRNLPSEIVLARTPRYRPHGSIFPLRPVTLAGAAPRPRIAEPQRRQQREIGALRPAIGCA